MLIPPMRLVLLKALYVLIFVVGLIYELFFMYRQDSTQYEHWSCVGTMVLSSQSKDVLYDN